MTEFEFGEQRHSFFHGALLNERLEIEEKEEEEGRGKRRGDLPTQFVIQ